MCQDYWTLLDPLSPAPETRAAFEAQLHNALKESFFERGFAPPALPPYRRLAQIATQDDGPLPPWSCGTIAMSTTLHLLLGDKHPHDMPSQCITREHVLALYRAMLRWLLTETPRLSGRTDA